MSKAHIYGKTQCSFCDQAKELLKANNIPFTFGNIETNDEERRDFREDFPTARTVPQIIIDGVKIGTCEDLKNWLKKQ